MQEYSKATLGRRPLMITLTHTALQILDALKSNDSVTSLNLSSSSITDETAQVAMSR